MFGNVIAALQCGPGWLKEFSLSKQFSNLALPVWRCQTLLIFDLNSRSIADEPSHKHPDWNLMCLEVERCRRLRAFLLDRL